MATYSSILAWRILWTEDPGRLQFSGLQRIGFKWATNTFTSLFFLVASHGSLCSKLMSFNTNFSWWSAGNDLHCPFYFFSACWSLLPDLQLSLPLPTQPLLILSHSLRLFVTLNPFLSSSSPCFLAPGRLSDYILISVSEAQPCPFLVTSPIYWESERVWEIIWAVKRVLCWKYSEDRRKATVSEVLTLTLDTVVTSFTCFPVNYGYVARWKWYGRGKGGSEKWCLAVWQLWGKRKL